MGNHIPRHQQPKDDGAPFPLFDIAVWPVLAQSPAFATLKEETVAAILHAYNRMAACNEQCAMLADMSHGSTSLLAHTSFAGRMKDPEVKLIHDQFIAYRTDLRGKLAGRLVDLCPNLEAAIDALEAEVGIKAVPAARRTFKGVPGRAAVPARRWRTRTTTVATGLQPGCWSARQRTAESGGIPTRFAARFPVKDPER